MGHPKRKRSSSNHHFFRGKLAVSFRYRVSFIPVYPQNFIKTETFSHHPWNFHIMNIGHKIILPTENLPRLKGFQLNCSDTLRSSPGKFQPQKNAKVVVVVAKVVGWTVVTRVEEWVAWNQLQKAKNPHKSNLLDHLRKIFQLMVNCWFGAFGGLGF